MEYSKTIKISKTEIEAVRTILESKDNAGASIRYRATFGTDKAHADDLQAEICFAKNQDGSITVEGTIEPIPWYHHKTDLGKFLKTAPDVSRIFEETYVIHHFYRDDNYSVSFETE